MATKIHTTSGQAKLVTMALLAAMPGLAGTAASGTNTIAPTMNVGLNVQTAVQLTLSTGIAGTPCAISAGGGGDFSVNFGNVNGLGAGTPSCGSVSTTASNATYATSYQLTASYSGFTSTSGSAVVVTTPGFSHPSTVTLGEASTTAGPFTNVPASGNGVSIATATSGVAIARALAVTVSNANSGSAFTGADSATVTFSLTVN